MAEKIVIKFSNGTVFHVDANIIANLRTEYYMQVDGITDRESKEWKEEFEQSLTTSELLDWVKNNMNWSDIAPHAQLQPKESTTFNFDDFFNSADIQITP